MTTDQIMEWRARKGAVSPLRPIEPGDKMLIFAQRGSYEWLMHPDDALYHCAFGIEMNGKTLACKVVEAAPLMNALTVQAKDPDVNVGFIPPDQAKVS